MFVVSMFWLEIIKRNFIWCLGFIAKIRSIRKISMGEGNIIKNNLTYFTWCSTPTYQHWSNNILSRNKKMISVYPFSLVLLKENVDRRVTLATCGVCFDICFKWSCCKRSCWLIWVSYFTTNSLVFKSVNWLSIESFSWQEFGAKRCTNLVGASSQ